jgi:hypothetical protein
MPATDQTTTKQKHKLSEVAPENRAIVVEVLKAGIIWKDLLSDFERRFITETAGRYAQFGDDMTVVGEQWNVFVEIARKLNLKSHV